MMNLARANRLAWCSATGITYLAPVSLRKAAHRLKQEIERELGTLAMERTTFAVQMTPVAGSGDVVEVEGVMVGPRGAEEVEFLISPNIGEEPRPLSKIASGGELSRIMLAIKKILTKGAHDQTLVFDEVDAPPITTLPSERNRGGRSPPWSGSKRTPWSKNSPGCWGARASPPLPGPTPTK